MYYIYVSRYLIRILKVKFSLFLFLGEIVSFVNRRGITSCYARFVCWRRIIFSLPELELMFVNRRKISPSLTHKKYIYCLCHLTLLLLSFLCKVVINCCGFEMELCGAMSSFPLTQTCTHIFVSIFCM